MPIRGDKIILETTRDDYLSISGIEVFTARLKSGTMSSNITKNVRYDRYKNFCVNAQGKDLPQTKINGKDSLNSCLGACAKNPKCSAGEWYNKGWNGSKCYHILTGFAKDRAVKADTGKRWRDAQCFTRS